MDSRESQPKVINRNSSEDKLWNFRRADYPGLYSYISRIDWSCILDTADANLAGSLLYSQLKIALDLFVPKMRRFRKSFFPHGLHLLLFANSSVNGTYYEN